jgi:hypothetical protein
MRTALGEISGLVPVISMTGCRRTRPFPALLTRRACSRLWSTAPSSRAGVDGCRVSSLCGGGSVCAALVLALGGGLKAYVLENCKQQMMKINADGLIINER